MYYTYLLRCADNSVYTGITTDLARRMREHFSSRTRARYTGAHPPVRPELAFESADRAAASRLEYRIKRLPKPVKEAIIAGRTLEPLRGGIEIGAYRPLVYEAGAWRYAGADAPPEEEAEDGQPIANRG